MTARGFEDAGCNVAPGPGRERGETMTTAKDPPTPEEIVPGFHLRVKKEPGAWTIECSGTLGAIDAASRVQPELLRLHDAAVANDVHHLTLDMHDVDYMNSSGIKGFVAWFLKADWSTDHRYTIELLYNPQRSWQSVSFSAIERLVPNILRVRAAAEA
jgi:hypothetical protein